LESSKPIVSFWAAQIPILTLCNFWANLAIYLFLLDFTVSLLPVVHCNMSNNPTHNAEHIFVTTDIEIDPWLRS